MTIELLASSAANAVAMAIGGIVAVVGISAVFYLVGRGEDRERAASARLAEGDDGADDGPTEPPPHDHPDDDRGGAGRARPPARRRRPRR